MIVYASWASSSVIGLAAPCRRTPSHPQVSTSRSPPPMARASRAASPPRTPASLPTSRSSPNVPPSRPVGSSATDANVVGCHRRRPEAGVDLATRALESDLLAAARAHLRGRGDTGVHGGLACGAAIDAPGTFERDLLRARDSRRRDHRDVWAAGRGTGAGDRAVRARRRTTARSDGENVDEFDGVHVITLSKCA